MLQKDGSGAVLRFGMDDSGAVPCFRRTIPDFLPLELQDALWVGDDGRGSEGENEERSRSPTPPLEPEMFQAKSPEVRGMFPPVEPDGFRLSLSEVFPKVSSRRTGGCGRVAELLFGLALLWASRLIRKGFEQSR
jgi:hypothetical protein